MIRKLKSGQYRLYTRKTDPKTNKRRNLGTFDSLPLREFRALTVLWAAPITGLIVFVMRRFGLLAFTAFVLCGDLLALSPLTTDFSAWYFGRGLAAAAAVAALAAYGFWTATVGQRWFKEGFFGDE